MLQATIRQSENNPEKLNKLFTQHGKKFKSTMKPSPLSLEDSVKAETKLVQLSHLHEYTEEISSLQEGAPFKKKTQHQS